MVRVLEGLGRLMNVSGVIIRDISDDDRNIKEKDVMVMSK
jgi:hypothetical protein